MPGLNISLDNQRYTCVIPDKLYRFESLDSGFVREIETDEYGLVLLYPGLFKGNNILDTSTLFCYTFGNE